MNGMSIIPRPNLKSSTSSHRRRHVRKKLRTSSPDSSATNLIDQIRSKKATPRAAMSSGARASDGDFMPIATNDPTQKNAKQTK